jgi:cytochrome c-type biogenesis protein CcmH/NrfG
VREDAVAAIGTRDGAGASTSDQWLFGRWLDLFVGCGLGYVILVPILLGFGYATGVRTWPTGAEVAFGMLINAPHYGATVLRVYERREGRTKYRFFAVYVTLALGLLLAAASRNVWLASVVITLYLTWSPWHFAGQNYGLALMFLRRSGVEIDALTKRLFYLSFVLSAALAMFAIHALAVHGGKAPLFSVSQTTLDLPGAPKLISLGIPSSVLRWLIPAAALGYAGCLAAVAVRLRGRGFVSNQAPAWMLVATQALWFTVPALTGNQVLPFAAIWISVAHSLQYLWVTAYYAKRSPARDPAGQYLGKALVAGLAVTNLPILVFAPDLLGTLPWDAGLAMTAFSIVNIHHFILDGAIWKLRDGGIARVLLRPATADAATAEPSPGSRLGVLVWTLAGLSLPVQALVVYGGLEILRDPTPERAAEVQRKLRWFGRESVGLHLEAARISAESGRDESAIGHYRRSIELFPNAEGWDGLGRAYARQGRLEQALDAFDRAVALESDSPQLLFRRARIGLTLAENGTRPDPGMRETIGILRRVLELQPDHARASLLLAGLVAETGRRDEAVEILERAIERGSAPLPRVRERLAELQQHNS